MAFIVIYDANVLYPNTLRDLLIRIAQLPHLVQAKWTDQILGEMSRALLRTRSDITEEKVAHLRADGPPRCRRVESGEQPSALT